MTHLIPEQLFRRTGTKNKLEGQFGQTRRGVRDAKGVDWRSMGRGCPPPHPTVAEKYASDTQIRDT